MQTTIEAASLGMGSLALALGGPEDAQRRVEAYWDTFHAGVQPMGLAVNPAVISFVMAMCARTDEEARDRGATGGVRAGAAGAQLCRPRGSIVG